MFCIERHCRNTILIIIIIIIIITNLVVDKTSRTLYDVGTAQHITLYELGGVTGDSVVHAALTRLAGVGSQLKGVCEKRDIRTDS